MPIETRKPSDPHLPDPLRWNHNIHYHPFLLAHLPVNTNAVLDVGCGDGMLTRQVALRAQQVTGIDLDELSIALAKTQTQQPNVRYLLGDVMTHPLPEESFDAIVSVATLHHLDTQSALGRFVRLLRPGGFLGIIGLARPEFPPRSTLGNWGQHRDKNLSLDQTILGTFRANRLAPAAHKSTDQTDCQPGITGFAVSPPSALALFDLVGQARVRERMFPTSDDRHRVAHMRIL